jgi:uncharacterized protein YjbJ (UPF0337 family)
MTYVSGRACRRSGAETAGQPETKETNMKDKITGKAEEIKGKVTGDKTDEMKGKARQTVGDVKQTGKEVAYDAEHPAPEETDDRV